MCAIAGVIGSTQAFSLYELGILKHRGPDDQGYYQDNCMWLGHQRLSILDLSRNGHQPMVSDNTNYVIVFNGEIYNHLEIRKSLQGKGYRFNSASDTETLLYGFMEYGVELFSMLNGIFAFAIYDKSKRKVYIARDHLGVKPLYYYEKEGTFMFSSEAKFFIQFPFFDKELRPEYLLNYVQFMYSPGNETLFRNVRKLPPGSYLCYDVDKRSFEVEFFFQIELSAEHEKAHDEQYWKQGLEKHLFKAVERQLLSDAPIGFFLSGGLDSSIIVAIARKILGKSVSLNCYTVDTGNQMRKEGFSDDLVYAKKVAETLDLNLSVIPSDKGFVENFDKIIWHLDEPQSDPAAMHVLNICTAASNAGIKVLLGGTGSDDIFSGYRRHQALTAEKYMMMVPSVFGTLVSKLTRLVGVSNPLMRRISKLANAVKKSKNERMVSYFLWIEYSEICSLLKCNPSMQARTKGEQHLLSKLSEVSKDVSDLNKMLYLELNGFLPDHNLNYTDKISMAAGVETRVPYLDIELFQFATQMPSKMKMKGTTTKYLLRKVAEDYLPHDVIYRPKTGFGAPVRRWVKHDMKRFFEERVLDSDVLSRDFFNKAEIEALVNKNNQGRVDASFSILALAAIESWLRQFYYAGD